MSEEPAAKRNGEGGQSGKRKLYLLPCERSSSGGSPSAPSGEAPSAPNSLEEPSENSPKGRYINSVVIEMLQAHERCMWDDRCLAALEPRK